MWFKKDKEKKFDAATLQQEHNDKVIECSKRLVNSLVKQIEQGIKQRHEEGYQHWYTSRYNNVLIRDKIINQPAEVTKLITEFIINYFENKGFKVQLNGDLYGWMDLFIQWQTQ